VSIIFLLLTISGIVGCSNKDENNLPISGVDLDYNQMDNNVHIFDWYVVCLATKKFIVWQ